jgi:hypothetical protein
MPPGGRRSPTIPPGMLPAVPPMLPGGASSSGSSGANELPGLPPVVADTRASGPASALADTRAPGPASALADTRAPGPASALADTRAPGPASALFSTSATVPSAPALNATLPPPSAMRAPAIVMEESPDGTMKIEPSKLAASDAAITQPRMPRAEEPDFGTDTPVKAPTRAELQALLDTPPDPTRKQTVEEIEALHLKALDRPSDPELNFDPHRRPHPTTEVRDDDIEAAIELAPAARKSSIGVAKKKPE